MPHGAWPRVTPIVEGGDVVEALGNACWARGGRWRHRHQAAASCWPAGTLIDETGYLGSKRTASTRSRSVHDHLRDPLGSACYAGRDCGQLSASARRSEVIAAQSIGEPGCNDDADLPSAARRHRRGDRRSDQGPWHAAPITSRKVAPRRSIWSDLRVPARSASSTNSGASANATGSHTARWSAPRAMQWCPAGRGQLGSPSRHRSGGLAAFSDYVDSMTVRSGRQVTRLSTSVLDPKQRGAAGRAAAGDQWSTPRARSPSPTSAITTTGGRWCRWRMARVSVSDGVARIAGSSGRDITGLPRCGPVQAHQPKASDPRRGDRPSASVPRDQGQRWLVIHQR